MPSARETYERAGAGESTIGWKLDRGQRRELLRQFPPRYRNPIADHVTLVSGAAADAPLPEETGAELIGRADDGRGVEAMVVRLGGTADRPDGSTYHITWSLKDGREARESNDVIAIEGWVEFDLPMPLILKPARWP